MSTRIPSFVSRCSALTVLALAAGCSTQRGPATSQAVVPPLPLPAQTLAHLKSAQVHNTARRFDFPWSDVEQYIAERPDHRLLIVGYGSLMNLASAAESIEHVNEKEFFPVVACGATRVFNYVIPDDVLAELEGDPASKERAALNVIASTRSTSIMNGRILPVAAQDLAAMRQREFGYHLRPVTCVRWDAPESEPFTAYVLCAEDAVVNGRRVIDNALLPNPAYVAICYDGATSVSPTFGDLFLDTTFLADGTTTLRQWLKSRACGSSQSQRIADSTP